MMDQQQANAVSDDNEDATREQQQENTEEPKPNRDLAEAQGPARPRVTVRAACLDQDPHTSRRGIKNSQSPHSLRQLASLGGEAGGVHAHQWKQFNVKQQNLTFQLTQQMHLQQNAGALGGTIVNSGFGLQSNIDSAQKLQKLIEKRQMAVAYGQGQQSTTPGVARRRNTQHEIQGIQATKVEIYKKVDDKGIYTTNDGKNQDLSREVNIPNMNTRSIGRSTSIKADSNSRFHIPNAVQLRKQQAATPTPQTPSADYSCTDDKSQYTAGRKQFEQQAANTSNQMDIESREHVKEMRDYKIDQIIEQSQSMKSTEHKQATAPQQHEVNGSLGRVQEHTQSVQDGKANHDSVLHDTNSNAEWSNQVRQHQVIGHHAAVKNQKEMLAMKKVTISSTDDGLVDLQMLDHSLKDSNAQLRGAVVSQYGVQGQRMKPILSKSRYVNPALQVQVKVSGNQNQERYARHDVHNAKATPVSPTMNKNKARIDKAQRQSSIQGFKTEIDCWKSFGSINQFNSSGISPFKLLASPKNLNTFHNKVNQSIDRLAIEQEGVAQLNRNTLQSSTAKSHTMNTLNIQEGSPQHQNSPMKVFGKNKSSLERESNIQVRNMVQSRMRSLLADNMAETPSKDGSINILNIVSTPVVNRPSKVDDATRSGRMFDTSVRHKRQQPSAVIDTGVRHRFGKNAQNEFAADQDEEETFEVILRENVNSKTNMNLNIVRNETPTMGLKMCQQETLRIKDKVKENDLPRTSLTISNEAAINRQKAEEVYYALQADCLSTALASPEKQSNADKDSKMDLNFNQFQESNMAKNVSGKISDRGNLAQEVQTDPLSSRSDTLHPSRPKWNHTADPYQSKAPSTQRRSVLKIQSQDFNTDPVNTFNAPQNAHPLQNQETSMQIISNYQENQASPKQYSKTTLVNTARVGQSHYGLGHAQLPDGAPKTQRYSNQQVVQVHDNRGGLNRTAMVFVVNKQENTVDFNSTGIGQMASKMRETQRNGFQVQQDSVLTNWQHQAHEGQIYENQEEEHGARQSGSKNSMPVGMRASEGYQNEIGGNEAFQARKQMFGASLQQTVTPQNPKFAIQFASTPQAQPRAFNPKRGQQYNKNIPHGKYNPTKKPKHTQDSTQDPKFEGFQFNVTGGLSLASHKIMQKSQDLRETSNQNTNKSSNHIHQLFNNEGITHLKYMPDDKVLNSQTPQSPSMSEIKTVDYDHHLKRPGGEGQDQYHVSMALGQDPKRSMASQDTLDKQLNETLCMKSHLADDVNTINAITPAQAEKMEAGAQRVLDSISQQEVQSNQVFMDNFRSYQESSHDAQNNVQEFEALRRNLEKQVNAIQKPQTSIRRQERESNREKFIKQLPQNMSHEVEVQKAFGGKHALSHLRPHDKGHQKPGAERALSLKQQLSPSILRSQIQNVSKAYPKRRDKVTSRQSRQTSKMVSNLNNDDLNLDIKLSNTVGFKGQQKNQLIKSHIEKQQSSVVASGNFAGSPLYDNHSVMTDPLSPMVGARMETKVLGPAKVDNRPKIELPGFQQKEKHMDESHPSLSHPQDPPVQASPPDMKTMSLFPPLKRRNISPRYNSSIRRTLFQDKENVMKLKQIKEIKRFLIQQKHSLIESYNQAPEQTQSQNRSLEPPQNFMVSGKGSRPDFSEQPITKEASPFKCIKLVQNDTQAGANARIKAKRPSVASNDEQLLSKSQAIDADQGAGRHPKTLRGQHPQKGQEHRTPMPPNEERTHLHGQQVATKALETDFVLSHISQENNSIHDSLQEYVDAQQNRSQSNCMSELRQEPGDGINTPAAKLLAPLRNDLQTRADQSGGTEMKELSIGGFQSQLDDKHDAKLHGNKFLDVRKVSIDFQPSKSTDRSHQNTGKHYRTSRSTKISQSKDEVMKQSVRDYVREHLNNPKKVGARGAGDLQQIMGYIGKQDSHKPQLLQFASNNQLLLEDPASIKYVRRIKNNDFWANRNAERQRDQIISQYSQDYEKLCIMHQGPKGSGMDAEGRSQIQLEKLLMKSGQDFKPSIDEFTREQIADFEKILHTNPVGLKTQQISPKHSISNYDKFPKFTGTQDGHHETRTKEDPSTKKLLICKLNQHSGSIAESTEHLTPNSLLQQTLSNQFIMSQLQHPTSREKNEHSYRQSTSGDEVMPTQPNEEQLALLSQKFNDLDQEDKFFAAQSEPAAGQGSARKRTIKQNKFNDALHQEVGALINHQSILLPDVFTNKKKAIIERKINERAENAQANLMYQSKYTADQSSLLNGIVAKHIGGKGILKGLNDPLDAILDYHMKQGPVSRNPKDLRPNLKKQSPTARQLTSIKFKLNQMQNENSHTTVSHNDHTNARIRLQSSPLQSHKHLQEEELLMELEPHPLEQIRGQRIEVREENQIQSMVRHNMMNNMANAISRFGAI